MVSFSSSTVMMMVMMMMMMTPMVQVLYCPEHMVHLVGNHHVQLLKNLQKASFVDIEAALCSLLNLPSAIGAVPLPPLSLSLSPHTHTHTSFFCCVAGVESQVKDTITC